MVHSAWLPSLFWWLVVLVALMLLLAWTQLAFGIGLAAGGWFWFLVRLDRRRARVGGLICFAAGVAGIACSLWRLL